MKYSNYKLFVIIPITGSDTGYLPASFLLFFTLLRKVGRSRALGLVGVLGQLPLVSIG